MKIDLVKGVYSQRPIMQLITQYLLGIYVYIENEIYHNEQRNTLLKTNTVLVYRRLLSSSN